MQRSVEHLQDALRIDAHFTLAHAALAETFATMGVYGMAAPHEVAPLARDAANRALAIDPRSAGALCARACVRAFFEWEWEEAEKDFLAAIDADPQYPTAYQWYASTVLVPHGRFGEAQELLARAHELDPLSLSLTVSRSAAAYYARDQQAAEGFAREALHQDAHFSMGHFFLGLALDLSGAHTDAVHALSRAVSLSESVEALAARGVVQVALGASASVDDTRAELERRGRVEYLSPVLLAQIAARSGDEQLALWYLQRATEFRSADLIWVGVRPVFETLHAHPEYRRILSELRLPLPTPA
jgi:tetratricopeptide (TPR) repeat protein